MHEIREKLLPIIFFQAGHVTRHVGNLSHGNRLISFSFRDSAWATRTPKDYTNQTESKWKEVTMSWTVSKWIFLWGFFHKPIKIYVKCSLIWMTTFLRFWRKKIIFAMSVTISFWFCHLSYKCWFKTMCVSLSASWSYIRITNVKGRALKL